MSERDTANAADSVMYGAPRGEAQDRKLSRKQRLDAMYERAVRDLKYRQMLGGDLPGEQADRRKP